MMTPLFPLLPRQRCLYFVVCLALCFACSEKPYSTKELSFPPNKDNWTYKGTITFSSKGNPDENNMKTVKIVVKDRQGNIVLDDSTNYKGTRMDARISWKKAAHIRVVIREKAGRTLSRTNYWFDSAKGKFR